ncbi:MAG: LamG domain-containing protein [Myxococcota bacterium]|nr:LamG domain-containing protein [Myxococcota bacterium]
MRSADAIGAAGGSRIWESRRRIALGKARYANNPFQDGQFDQFGIYSRALSDVEVQQLFQQKQ